MRVCKAFIYFCRLFTVEGVLPKGNVIILPKPDGTPVTLNDLTDIHLKYSGYSLIYLKKYTNF